MLTIFYSFYLYSIMDIPNELPVIYITPILIPGFILKIRLEIENK